jgi:hypothetical protein
MRVAQEIRDQQARVDAARHEIGAILARLGATETTPEG